jgi:hypothetical protein
MQTRAIDNVKAIILGKSKKSITEALSDAGFADESVRQWTNVMKGLRPHLASTIEWMEKHRLRVQERMEKTIEMAEYKDLVKALDTLNYNIQLLGGRPTHNIAISADVRMRMEALIDE